MKEKFYDEEIAPTLLELGKKCQEAGITLVWVTELMMGRPLKLGMFQKVRH